MAEQFSNEELDAYQDFLRKKRIDRARRMARSASATAAVVSGRETAPDAMARRELYPDVMTPMQKEAAKADVLPQYGGLEQGYYQAGLGALTNIYTADMATYSRYLGAQAGLKETSARLRQRGLEVEAAHVRGMYETLTDLTPEAAAFVRRNSSGAGYTASQGPASIEDILLGKLGEGEGQPISPEQRALGEAEILRTVRDFDSLDPQAALRAANSIQAYATMTGVDLPAFLKANNAEIDFAYIAQAAEQQRQGITDNYDTLVQQQSQVGAGQLPSFQQLMESDGPQFAGGVQDYDPEKQLLPGIDIVPESDAMSRYVQVMDVIDAQPEAPPMVEAKQAIMARPEYQAYKESRGYTGMDDNQVWQEYGREVRGGLRDRKQEFRRQKRANIESGTARGRVLSSDRPKPNPTAEVAGE